MSNSQPSWDKVSIWVKLFVFFHILAITAWTLPRPPITVLDGTEPLVMDTASPASTIRSLGRYLGDGTLLFNDQHLKPSPIKYYMVGTGFWQHWSMFAPNPANVDIYPTATIHYADGTQSSVSYRMFDLPLHEKYIQERYRKYFEKIAPESERYTWPYFAQGVAVLSQAPGKRPTKVVLAKNSLRVEPPSKSQPTKYTRTEFYEHTVDPKKLPRPRTP